MQKLRQREERTTVCLGARMRVESAWADVAIRNVSAHGMMLSSDTPPRPGSYLEIRRAATLIVARAVWRSGKLFGVRTQDLVDLSSLVETEAAAVRRSADGVWTERRTTDRRNDAADRGRAIASAAQFVFAAAVAIVAAALAAGLVWRVLVTPLREIERALGAPAAGTAGYVEAPDYDRFARRGAASPP